MKKIGIPFFFLYRFNFKFVKICIHYLGKNKLFWINYFHSILKGSNLIENIKYILINQKIYLRLKFYYTEKRRIIIDTNVIYKTKKI